MKATEFARWIEQAGEKGATHIEVRRAAQTGAKSSTIFFVEEVARVDVERLLERMREDVLSRHRRLSKGYFEVRAFKGDEDVMRDSVVILRDEPEDATQLEGQTIEGASVRLARDAWSAAREAHQDLRAMAVDTAKTLQSVAEQLSAKLVESNDRAGQVMSMAFEMASLRHEREEAAQASAERRELAGKAISELAPIVGAGMAYVTKNATPAWAALAQRIQSSGKLPQLLELMADDSELVALFGEAVGHTFPKKEGGSHVEGSR